MGGYHFEEDDRAIGKTIRLDDINQKVRSAKETGLDATGVFRGQEYIRSQDLSASIIQRNLRDEEESMPVRRTSSSGGRRRKENNPYRIFMLLAIIAGLIVCLGMFLVAFFSTRSGKPTTATPGETVTGTPGTTPPAGIDTTTPAIDSKETKQYISLVKNINASKELTLLNIETDAVFSLRTNSDTSIEGKNGEAIHLGNIAMGDIVSIHTKDDYYADAIRYEESCWVLKDQTGVEIKPEEKAVYVEGRAYQYSDSCLATYQDRVIDLQKIDTGDKLTLQGVNNTVYSMQVLEYHGYISVLNQNKITDGAIQIDENEPVKLGETDKITLSPGRHNIKISGSNIETYTNEIYITAEEEYVVDMSAMQEKTSVVILKVNVDSYQLFVNDTAIQNPGEPLVLKPGEYTFRIEKEGYVTWTNKITLSEPSMEVNASLKQQPKVHEMAVSSNPMGASVYIDDVYIGITPVTKNIEEGEHQVMFKMEGYYDMTLPIKVDNMLKPVHATLEEK